MAKTTVFLKQGYDIGNGYTKWDNTKFPSRVKIGQNRGLTKSSVATNVFYKGEWYTVGQGRTFVERGRHFDLNYELCLLTAIARKNKHLETINVDICLGLPVIIYMEDEVENEKMTFERLIERYENKSYEIILKIDGLEKTYNINIGKVDVFTEGAYPMHNAEKGKILVIDIGSGTMNVTQFTDMEIVEFNTYKKGMEVLNGVIQKKLSVMLPFSNVPIDYIDDIFIDDGFLNTSIKIGNDTISTVPIKNIIDEYVKGVWSKIGQDFDLGGIDKIYLMGGGSLSIGNYFKTLNSEIVTVDNAQNINVNIYEKVCELDE